MTASPHLSVASDRLGAVRALYDGLATDLAFADTAPPPAPDPAAAAFLTYEARLLDAGRRDTWLALVEAAGWFWVPLPPSRHPGRDQSLILDDRRRLTERVWRFMDTNAWALQPGPRVVRAITGVEAWPCPAQRGETIVASVITLARHDARGAWSTIGRQVHRLVRMPDDPAGFRIRHKILDLPALGTGTPHLAWLL